MPRPLYLLFNLGRYGNLALFAGGNYLLTELTVSGNVALDPDLLSVDYRIEQENKDNRNIVIGGNWSINRSWSWSLEYNGFTGTRDAWISSLTWSF